MQEATIWTKLIITLKKKIKYITCMMSMHISVGQNSKIVGQEKVTFSSPISPECVTYFYNFTDLMLISCVIRCLVK